MLGVLWSVLAPKEDENAHMVSIPQPNSASERRETEATVAIVEAEVMRRRPKYRLNKTRIQHVQYAG